jgi:uncharacterized Zn finger protein (UPF0148 family)
LLLSSSFKYSQYKIIVAAPEEQAKMEGEVPEKKEGEEIPLKKEGEYYCPYCGAGPFKYPYSLGGHLRKCEKKPRTEEEEERRAEERRGPPFIAPKSPEEVLEEVLRQHGLKEEFIQYAVQRSKMFGGIHPNDLWNMLQDMDAGLKSKGQIKYIVEDYTAALMREQMLAQERGLRISYPLFKSETPQAYTGILPPHPPSTSQPVFVPSQTTSYPAYQLYPSTHTTPAHPPISIEDIRKMVAEQIGALNQEKRIDELEKRLALLERTLPQQIEESVKRAIPIEMFHERGMTKEEIEAILAQREKDAYIKYLEERNKDLIEQFKQLRERVEQELNRPVLPSEKRYSRDEVQLLADALTMLSQKQPIKDLGEIVIRLIPGGGTRAPPTLEKVGEAGIISKLPPELVE